MPNTLHESCLQWPVAPTPHRKVAYNITPKLMAGYTVTVHTTPKQMHKGYVGRWQKKRQSEKWTNIQAAVIQNSESLRSLKCLSKSRAASQIDYACTPLKTQTAKVPELCWIIYRLVLVFTGGWAEFKGTRWRIKVWALWKHHHSQHEHQHHKELQLCWVQAEASRYYQSRSHQGLSWHRGREFREGVQSEHAHVQTLQVLSMCLLDFWESRGKPCAKQRVTHPIFYHNTSSPSSWFFYACHTPDFLGCFCLRDIHQAGTNWRPSHAFFTYGLTRFETRTLGKKLSILSPPKCKLYLGELEFSSFITAWAS